MEFQPTETREADFDAEFPYVLWDYYIDKVDEGELTLEEARTLYLQDMGQQDGAA